MRRLLFVLAFPLFAACDDTSSGPQEPLEEATVSTGGQKFTPASVELVQNGTVTWAFDGVGHTVTFSAVAGAPANIPLSANTNVTKTFSTIGTFPYHCDIHSGMNGTIIVR
jgi:plastocyanin